MEPKGEDLIEEDRGLRLKKSDLLNLSFLAKALPRRDTSRLEKYLDILVNDEDLTSLGELYFTLKKPDLREKLNLPVGVTAGLLQFLDQFMELGELTSGMTTGGADGLGGSGSEKKKKKKKKTKKEKEKDNLVMDLSSKSDLLTLDGITANDIELYRHNASGEEFHVIKVATVRYLRSQGKWAATDEARKKLPSYTTRTVEIGRQKRGRE